MEESHLVSEQSGEDLAVRKKLSAISARNTSRSTLSSHIQDLSLLEAVLCLDMQRQCLKAALKTVQAVADRNMGQEEAQLIHNAFFRMDEGTLAKKIEQVHLAIYRNKGLKSGKESSSLIQALDIPEEAIQVIWRIAKFCIAEKEYESAYQVLFLLLALEPVLVDAWVAYGHVNQRMKSLNTALHAYLTAKTLARGHIPSHNLFIADCYIDMHCIKEALQYLEEFYRCDVVDEQLERLAFKTKEKIMREQAAKQK